MTFTEAFIITLVGLVGLLMWLIIVASRVSMDMATKSTIAVMKAAKR